MIWSSRSGRHHSQILVKALFYVLWTAAYLLCAHMVEREPWCLASGSCTGCTNSITLNSILTTSGNFIHLPKDPASNTWGVRSSIYEFGGWDIIQSTALRELRSRTHHWQNKVPISQDPFAWDCSSYSWDIAMVISMQTVYPHNFKKVKTGF